MGGRRAAARWTEPPVTVPPTHVSIREARAAVITTAVTFGVLGLLIGALAVYGWART